MTRLGKVLDHLEVDVRLQKRQAHLPQGFIDVFFGELAAVAQQAEDGIQLFREDFKHTV